MRHTNQSKHPVIVLAEDDEDDQLFIELAFKKVNPEQPFYIASNGRDVVNYLTSLKNDELPCLIILDLNMPVLDGWETLEEINRHKRFDKIPKVIFTTSDIPEHKEKSLRNGAVDYMVKPSNMTDIFKSIDKMIGYCRDN